jgi:hypothetical protein
MLGRGWALKVEFLICGVSPGVSADHFSASRLCFPRGRVRVTVGESGRGRLAEGGFAVRKGNVYALAGSQSGHAPAVQVQRANTGVVNTRPR